MYNEGYPVLDEDEAEWSTGQWMFQWAYNYNGKVIVLNVALSDSGAAYSFSIHE